MNRKHAKNAERIARHAGRDLPAPYLAFFECFNAGLYFEAHDVLEELWLPQRRGPNGDFFKGLIQLAGAFVHVQKGRHGPATALLTLSRRNLEKYPPVHIRLDLRRVAQQIEEWQRRLVPGSAPSALLAEPPRPHLELES